MSFKIVMPELSSKPIANKLGLKQNMQVMIINAPDDFLSRLGKLPDGVTLTTKAKLQADLVLTFVQSIAELNWLVSKSLEAIKSDGLFWFAYPKQSSTIKTDINRDSGWKALTDQGYDTVTAISIDDTWTALRFRMKKHIGKKSTHL